MGKVGSTLLTRRGGSSWWGSALISVEVAVLLLDMFRPLKSSWILSLSRFLPIGYWFQAETRTINLMGGWQT